MKSMELREFYAFDFWPPESALVGGYLGFGKIVLALPAPPLRVLLCGIGGRLLTSGKYNTACFKGHLWMAFHGLILGLELDVGVNHDMRILDDCTHRYLMRNNEWGLGDLAYGGAPRYLCGVKESANSPINDLDAYCTALIAFYRARVEQVIARLKRHAWCQQVFRGSYEMLVVHFKITGALTALSIKRQILAGKPLFEVVGPWPHNI